MCSTRKKHISLIVILIFSRSHIPSLTSLSRTSFLTNSLTYSVNKRTDHLRRFDSDIVDLYGALTKRQTPLEKNYTEIVAKKTKFAAWLVSHCSTFGKREDYIKLMRQHVTVDAYGACSPSKCPRSSDDACFQMISEKYKFFLAFENAFCKDYISEKFFRYLEANTVVVARGSNEYKVLITFHDEYKVLITIHDEYKVLITIHD